MTKKHHPASVAAHAAGARDEQSAGIVPPIQLATTFERGEDYALLNADNVYLRPHAETARHVERLIANLEDAKEALLYPSGMAAIAAVFRWLPSGGRAVVQKGIYWGTTKWTREFAARRNIELVELDASDKSELEKALSSKADLVFIETPSNPWLKTVDIENTAKLAHAAGAVFVVDSTAATPLLTKPLNLGADIVMHSATKAMNGHSDVLAGVLAAKDTSEVWERIRTDRADSGVMTGPFEAWLLLRGLRTLPLRVERMCDNALALAEFLEGHDQVESVFYPGLASHAGHEQAQRQMNGGFGYLMSVCIKGGKENALKVAGKLRMVRRASSLGGVESLVEHRFTVESDTGLPENLLRVSVGIEHIDDLIADFAQALES